MTNTKYTEDHEWATLDDGIVTVGITDFAQDQLGDIVFIELPRIGQAINQGDEGAIIESVKAAGDVKCPVGGEVAAVNESLVDSPEQVNKDPMGDGWFYKVRASDLSEWEQLMSKQAYETFVAQSN